MKATIYSIARELGISASTVSRAFSRPDLVNSKVRERILATAAAQGYELNRTARGLRTGRTGLIGVLVLDITNPFFPPLVRAIERAADEADASVLLVDAVISGGSAADQLKRLGAQVDGLIVASPQQPAKDLKAAIGQVPTVLVDRKITGIPSVICDNTAALHHAADHLVELGHQRILLLRGPADLWTATQRASAIREWAKQAPSGVEVVELGPYKATFDAGRESAAAVAETEATAIITFDDYVACGVVSGLAELGLSVPDDYSVVGCDDVLLARVVTPQLSTISTPVDDLGHRAVELLSDVMSGRKPRNERLAGAYTPRGTTAHA